MFAKAGLGLVGLSAISVGGVALAKPHLLGMDYMPKWHSLSEDNGFDSGYADKFGKKYGKYLVGVTHKKGTEGKAKKENNAWWEWAYRRFQANKPTTDSKFKSVNKPYGTDTTALNKVCEDAYKKGDSEFQTTASSANFTKEEVWKYCSPGKLTVTLEDTDKYEATQIGGEEANKKVLISVKNSDNDWFWEIRNRDFWEASGDWSGNSATSGSSFKTAYSNKDSSSTPRKTIKKLCEDAYKLTKSENGNTSEETDAKKFCKLEA